MKTPTPNARRYRRLLRYQQNPDHYNSDEDGLDGQAHPQWKEGRETETQATFIPGQQHDKSLKTGAASAEHGNTGPKRQAEDSKLHTAQKMRIRHLIMARWPAGNGATQKCAAGKYGE